MTATKLSARVPRPVPDCDVRSLPLGPIDAFVLSRVDGATTEIDIGSACGLDPLTLRAGLDRLCTLGAIRFDGVAIEPPRPAPSAPPAGAEPVRRVALARLLAGASPPRSAPPPVSSTPPRRTGDERAPDSKESGQKHLAEGDARARLGDWHAAATAYVRACPALPDDWRVRQRAAMALLRSSGDLHLAADLAKQAVDRATSRVEPRLVLAQVYIAAGLPTAARRVLEHAAQIAPGDERITTLQEKLGRRGGA